MKLEGRFCSCDGCCYWRGDRFLGGACYGLRMVMMLFILQVIIEL